MPKVTLTLNDEMYQQDVGQSLACLTRRGHDRLLQRCQQLGAINYQRVERDKAHILHSTE